MFNVDKYLEIPFKDGGRSFAGCDCFGLVYLIYKEFGITLKDYSISCKESSLINDKIREESFIWEQIPFPQIPSLVTIRLSSNPLFINHVGVVVKEGYFLHSTEETGVALTRLDSNLWKRKITGFWIPTEGATQK